MPLAEHMGKQMSNNRLTVIPTNGGLSLNWRMVKGHGIFISLSLLWLLALIGAVQSNSLLAWSSGLLYIAYDTWLITYIAWRTRHIADGFSTRQADQTASVRLPLTVAVIIPARNEADVIATTIKNVLAQTDLPERILIVNDGSTDQTAALLQAQFGLAAVVDGVAHSTLFPVLSVMHTPHTGKADSLTTVFALLVTDLIVPVDPYSLVSPLAIDSLQRAV